MNATKQEKPNAYRLEGPDGREFFVGVTAASKWLGLSVTTVRKIAQGNSTEYATETVERVRAEFPALFPKERRGRL